MLLVFGMFALLTGRLVAQQEKVLVIGHAESTDSLDPARAFTQTSGIVHKATYDTLVTFPNDSAAKILPSLATSWDISSDGLTYTFTLRDGVKFSNGDPLMADDVAFSITRMINVKSNPSANAGTIASVKADGANKVVLTLNASDPAILSKLVGPGFQIVDSKVVKANGGTDAADADKSDQGEAWLNAHSAGTGPYMLDSWDKQVKTVLVRNPNYWGTAPYFDRIIIQNMPEAASQKTALEAGDVDLALDLTADQVSQMESNKDLTIYKGAGNIVHFLLMNQDPNIGGPMANPKVEEAVRLALDYEGYVKLFGGVTPPSVIPVGFLGAYGSDKALKRDLDKAKSLLKDAGYADGFQVTLDYPDFTFQGVNMDTNAQKVASDLAEVGIKVKLNKQELQVSLDNYRQGKQGFGYWFWGPDYMDPEDYILFMPDLLVGKRANWTEAGGADKTALDIRDRASKETDPDKRNAVFGEMQDYLQQNGPWAPFLQPGVQTAFRANIQGYVWHPQWLLDVALLSRSG
jgi:peptide/nickel transport system substrate-binding protein